MYFPIACLALMVANFQLGLPLPQREMFDLRSIPNINNVLLIYELGQEHTNVESFSESLGKFEKRSGKNSEHAVYYRDKLATAIKRRDALEKQVDASSAPNLRQRADDEIQRALDYRKSIAGLTIDQLLELQKCESAKAERDRAASAIERERLIRIRDGKE